MNNNFIRDLILIQNKELLTRIANDKFDSPENREIFIANYHKKNYAVLNITKKDTSKSQIKKYKKMMRLKDS